MAYFPDKQIYHVCLFFATIEWQILNLWSTPVTKLFSKISKLAFCNTERDRSRQPYAELKVE